MSQTLTNVQPVKRLAHRIKDAAVIAGLSRKASQLAVRGAVAICVGIDFGAISSVTILPHHAARSKI